MAGPFPGLTVRPAVAHVRPVDELLRRSEWAQLLVVGGHGRGAHPGLRLGPVADTDAVVHRARMPVIVARQQ